MIVIAIGLFIIVSLVFSIWKCWTYKCMCHGLMYFAENEHDWELDELELKKYLSIQ